MSVHFKVLQSHWKQRTPVYHYWLFFFFFNQSVCLIIQMFSLFFFFRGCTGHVASAALLSFRQRSHTYIFTHSRTNVYMYAPAPLPCVFVFMYLKPEVFGDCVAWNQFHAPFVLILNLLWKCYFWTILIPYTLISLFENSFFEIQYIVYETKLCDKCLNVLARARMEFCPVNLMLPT